MKVNYYEVLGVERSATDGEIRDRFRKLARENHPDRYRGTDKAEAERKFQTLTEAVNVLTNPDKRKQHDTLLLGSPASSPAIDFVQIGKAYLARGVKAFRERNWLEAFNNFDMSAKHNPQDAKAFHYAALAAAKMPSHLRQAVHAIEAAVQRDPVNAVFLKDAGLICKEAKLNSKAIRYLEEALKWDAENVEVQMALAELREAKEAKGGFSIFGKR